jgi:hypothetical protein
MGLLSLVATPRRSLQKLEVDARDSHGADSADAASGDPEPQSSGSSDLPPAA